MPCRTRSIEDVCVGLSPSLYCRYSLFDGDAAGAVHVPADASVLLMQQDGDAGVQ